MKEPTKFVEPLVKPDAASPEVCSPDADREAMTLTQQGDREAFGKLFERHAASVWRVAYLLLHSASAADDALQESFLNALARIETYRGEAAPKAWLCSIAVNVCRHVLRDRREKEAPAEARTLERGHAIGASLRGVLTNVLRRERSRRLAIMLGFLTRAQREVFVLHYVEGLPYEEVSLLLGVSPGGARALAHRARIVLRASVGSDTEILN